MIHQHLDLGLGHRRSDPNRLWVWMEAPSVAISPLGLMLDLMWHKVFMCIRRRMMARSGSASTSLVGADGWMDGRGSTAVARWLRCARERESNGGGRESDGGRQRGMGSTPPQAVLFIGGSTESIRCGSFHRTKCLNVSIPRTSRENQGGIFGKQVTTTT
jgi:hypothetical protein